MNFLRRERWFLGFLGVMAGLLLLVWGWGTGRDSGWWAAWGQWVGGLGSIAAAWTAVWIAVEGWRRSDQRAREQDRRAENESAREQASKFAVWVAESPRSTGEPVRNITWMNASSLPVHDVIVMLVIAVEGRPDEYGKASIFGAPNVPPTRTPEEVPGSNVTLRNFIDSAAKNYYSPESRKESIASFRLAIARDILVTVSFRDNNGKNWVRYPDGVLEERQVDGLQSKYLQESLSRRPRR